MQSLLHRPATLSCELAEAGSEGIEVLDDCGGGCRRLSLLNFCGMHLLPCLEKGSNIHIPKFKYSYGPNSKRWVIWSCPFNLKLPKQEWRVFCWANILWDGECSFIWMEHSQSLRRLHEGGSEVTVSLSDLASVYCMGYCHTNLLWKAFFQKCKHGN